MKADQWRQYKVKLAGLESDSPLSIIVPFRPVRLSTLDAQVEVLTVTSPRHIGLMALDELCSSLISDLNRIMHEDSPADAWLKINAHAAFYRCVVKERVHSMTPGESLPWTQGQWHETPIDQVLDEIVQITQQPTMIQLLATDTVTSLYQSLIGNAKATVPEGHHHRLVETTFHGLRAISRRIGNDAWFQHRAFAHRQGIKQTGLITPIFRPEPAQLPVLAITTAGMAREDKVVRLHT